MLAFIRKWLIDTLKDVYEEDSKSKSGGLFSTTYSKVIKLNEEHRDIDDMVKLLATVVTEFRIPKFKRSRGVQTDKYIASLREAGTSKYIVSYRSRVVRNLHYHIKELASLRYDDDRADDLDYDDTEWMFYVDLPKDWRKSCKVKHRELLGAWWARVSYLTKGVVFEEVDGAI